MKDINSSIPLPTKPSLKHYWEKLPVSLNNLAIAETINSYQAPVVIITPDLVTATQVIKELKFFASNSKLVLFPGWETLPYDRFSPHQDISAKRLLTLDNLIHKKFAALIVPISTLMHKVVPLPYVTQHSFNLHVGETLDLIELRNSLTTKGYYQVNQVIEHGEFAIRGSLIDIFPAGSTTPFRIDLFDNEVETIRIFDPETQLSDNNLTKINILPGREIPLDEHAIEMFKHNWEQHFVSNAQTPIYKNITKGNSFPGIEYYLPLFFEHTNSLLDYIPANSLLILHNDLLNHAENFWNDIKIRYEQLRYDRMRPILAPAEIFIPVAKLWQSFANFPQIHLNNNKPNVSLPYKWKNIPDLTVNHKIKSPFKNLTNFLDHTKARILFCAESSGRREALVELLQTINIKPNVYASWQKFIETQEPLGICIAQLTNGFCYDDIILITEAQLLGNQIIQHQAKPPTQDPETAIHNLIELNIGDPVVHIEHGIGYYQGLQTLIIDDQKSEFLCLQYANDAKLYIPVTSLHLISRYLGTNTENIPISQLGSKKWTQAKAKAITKIQDVAAKILNIHALRASQTGFAFRPSDQYQLFANTFSFELTRDQDKAIKAVINDMLAKKSMDRLICGDVGFGKTEVAMRAAFLAVANNKQVAILTPTTLLAQQHYDNFCDRFSDWPVRIGMLSRFNPKKLQQKIIEDLANGKLDIIIATHRLLQQDIKFKDLRLLIIDEEHRFGVADKEKLTTMRANLDILTLTATPIPRTLSMALTNIRDLSIIATPPQGRLAIKTFVQQYQLYTIKEAIQREVLRGGQVYFLHNDIDTIEKTAQQLTELLPNINVGIAHGQMRARQLEQIMGNFAKLKYNVLVCTTIIESGIDIPTANTIIINNADRFGLAQLYQLRGRVGRSHHQAYAYLLIRSKKAITKDAKKRLEAISSLGELGSGFMLATSDLEIRGAGEILGEEQSGQIQAIGYNLYMEFLQQAVDSLKKGKKFIFQPLQPLIIEIQIPALIPDDFIRDVHTRLMFYKRIASAKNKSQLEQLQVELIDRFGLLPEATKNLFAITTLKFKAEELGIKKITAGLNKGSIIFDEKPNIDPSKIINLIQKQPNIYKLQGQNKLQFKLASQEEKQILAFTAALLKDLS